MTIRTISQLPELTSTISESAFIEVSQLYGNAYISEKLKYSSLKSALNNYLSASIGDAFKMYRLDSSSKKQPLNLSSMYTNINTLSAGNTNLYGVKTFKSIPKITVSD